MTVPGLDDTGYGRIADFTYVVMVAGVSNPGVEAARDSVRFTGHAHASTEAGACERMRQFAVAVLQRAGVSGAQVAGTRARRR